ncbi:MAG: PucR family transcriptional regulator [Actinobacteria bacterium]|nr:PucR family transcriptional regulator [Actinomycetota bacterium]
MEEGLPWYRELGAQERSWVGLVAQAGINAFVTWYNAPTSRRAFTEDVFGAAPRELARILSLEQTVALVRTTIAVVESAIEELSEPADRPALREAILLYSREIAFSAAEVYARAAEARGAWDARLEALIVEALQRDDLDEAVLGRAAALGWTGNDGIVVVAGAAPAGDPEGALEVMRRAAANHGLDLLTGIHGTTVLALIGRVTDPARAARVLSAHFGDGAVVHSTLAASFAQVPDATRATLQGLRAAPAWVDAPRPVSTEDLLPERVLAGDEHAASQLVEQVYRQLVGEPALLQTASVFLEQTPSLEATARILFIHPNTVRYRLKRIAELTGWSATDPRGSYALRLGLTLGRLSTQPT